MSEPAIGKPPIDMNPRWRQWYAELAEDKRGELMAAWDAAITEAAIIDRYRNSAYARKRLLIDQSLGFGYEP